MEEIELKFALDDRGDYERIVSILGEPRAVFEQTNHYFLGDAAGILQRGEAMLRLRTVITGAVLTFKEGLVREGALFRCREIEAPLDDEATSGVLAGTLDLLTLEHPAAREAKTRLRDGGLRVGGVSRTRRSEFLLGTGEVLQIDASVFPGGLEDWEIELETGDPAASERHLRGLIGRMGVVLRPQTRTKYRRFLDAVRSP